MKVYLADTTPLLDSNTFRHLSDLVPPERQKKIDTYHFMKDKVLSLGAGLLLKHGLKSLGITDYTLFCNDYGKPYLCPPWNQYYFNLSHSGEYVMAVFDDLEVGCDIEKMTEPDMVTAKFFFSPKEYELLVNSKDLKKSFFKLWTRKESLAKAMGTGLSEKTCSFSNHHYFFHTYTLPDEYAGCVCSLKNAFPDEPEIVHFGV